MSFWHKEHYRGWVGMTALVLLALVSILVSAWGMIGFSRPDFFAAATPKAQAIILADGTCTGCSSPESFLAEFEAQGYVITSRRTVDVSTKEGQKLVADYAIVKAPTVILRKTSGSSQEFLKQFGDVKTDGTFILRDVVPPYRSATDNTIKGRFGIILITDKTCKECYDVTLHKTPLSRLGMTPTDEKIVDIADAEGKQLVEKYNIETVPTLIMQGDLEEYASLKQVWGQVGTVESDGAYVFRSGQDNMGPYRVLKTKEIKQPSSQL